MSLPNSWDSRSGWVIEEPLKFHYRAIKNFDLAKTEEIKIFSDYHLKLGEGFDNNLSENKLFVISDDDNNKYYVLAENIKVNYDHVNYHRDTDKFLQNLSILQKENIND